MAERRRFTKEYKVAAVRPLLTGAKRGSQQAEDLGLDRTQLPSFTCTARRLEVLPEGSE
jgi:transposase-like protein